MDKEKNASFTTPTVNPGLSTDLNTERHSRNPIFQFLNASENLCLQLVDPETSKPIYSLTIEENVTSLLEKENESILSQNDDKPCHSWTFGRSALKSTFVLKDVPRFSNLHFEITLERNCRLYLKDMSTNGTWLNGHQIPQNLKVKLADGDVIGIGYGILKQACNFQIDFNTGFMAQYRYYFLMQLKKAGATNAKELKNNSVISVLNKREREIDNENELTAKKQKLDAAPVIQKGESPETPVEKFKKNIKGLVAKTNNIAQKKEVFESKRVTNEKLQLDLDNDEEKLQVQHYNAVHNANVKTMQELPISQRFDFQRTYEIMDVILGKGAFGIVKKCLKKASKKEYAVKIMKRNKLDEKTKVAFLSEIGMLNNISHKRILNVDHSSWDKSHYYIVTELIPGGDLMDFIGKYGAIDEKASVEIAFQILEGVQYLHSHNIIHRDLKPDNILIVQDCPVVIKIADFGLSKKGNEFKSFCGTMAYLAPEIIGNIKSRHDLKPKNLRPSYTHKADIWSIGCLIYVILTNHLPFSAPTEDALFDCIRKAEYSEIPLIEGMVSSACLQFLKRMICPDVFKRYSASEALTHEWFGDRKQVANNGKNLDVSFTQDIPLSQLPRGTADKLNQINKEDEFVMDKWKQNPFMDGSSQPWKKQKDPIVANVLKNTLNTSMKTTKKMALESRLNEQGIVSSDKEPSANVNNNCDVSYSKFNSGFAEFRERVLKDQNEKNNFKDVSFMNGLIGLTIRKPGILASDNKTPNETRVDINTKNFSIGRSKMSDYVISDGTISKLHCVFITHANSVNDNNSECSLWLYSYSTNHIYVNDTKMKKFSKTKVWAGDVIKLVYNVQSNNSIEIVVDYLSHEIDSKKLAKPDGMINWEANRDLVYTTNSYQTGKKTDIKPPPYKCKLYGDSHHADKHCICSARTLRLEGNPDSIYPKRESPINMTDEEIDFSKEFLLKS